ncbi:MAG TPA: LURP-one-related family protein [Thermoanaerobaculia bacterium]|jgi:uncharacterized protein YxjI
MARYKMRQKMISLGEDFTIEDESGNRAFEVDGKVMRLRETFELKDRNGNVVATIRGKLVSVRKKMDIIRGDDVAATVTKALFAPFRTKFQVDLAGGGELSLDGDILDHEYTLRRDDNPIATVSKRWFSFTDTYGIEIAPGADDALVLAIAVAVDEMAHDKDE